MTKSLICLFLLSVLICCFFVGFNGFCVVRVSADAGGIPSPSAPEFTVEFVDSSYDVPPTYEIDDYTGETVVDKSGYSVENKSLVLTIKNQEFPAYVNGTRYYMAYNVAVKGHFAHEWRGLDFESERTMESYLSEGFPRASHWGYTLLYLSANDYPENSQLDVKVQAYIGHEAVIQVTDYYGGGAWWFPAGSHKEDGIIFDTEGDWSEIQTITINVPTSEIHIADVPTSETCQINFLILIGALVLIPLAVGLVLLVYLSKRKHSN